MATNAPLHNQIEYMILEMDKGSTKDACSKRYMNYLNLYRNEYPKAYRAITFNYSCYKSLNSDRLK